MKRIVVLFMLTLMPLIASAQVHLSERTKIITRDGSAETETAAKMLQRFLGEATGLDFPLSKESPRRGDIVLENAGADDLPEDAFRLHTAGETLYISGNGKGIVYGVCDFLEQEMQMNYWGNGEYDLPLFRAGTKKGLPLFVRTRTEIPTFRYRQTQAYILKEDPLFRWWYRLEEPSDVFADNLWVHTCNRLLPASRYGSSHPEYYAYYGGERHPGSASQWCFSNAEVLEIVCERVDSLFRANPDRHMISISQNDGSDTYCRCPDCQRIMDEEGTPAGPVLRFVNAVADRFPDKEISTLAYLFTVTPPRVTRPRPNVNIMLCDIDCRRQTALTENPSGQAFMTCLEGWSAITDNIFLWDYGINFDNYLSPFPNLQTLKDNMLIFKDHNVKMHFSQIGNTRGGDMAELRPYLVSKLMWNADASLDSLERHFCQSYYGEAAPFILRYIHTMEGAAVGTDVDLFIYDSPVSYKDNILRPALMARYNRLFDQAEAAVAGDSLRLARVQRSRLPLRYSALELARTDPERDAEAVQQALDAFEGQVRRFGVVSLNERSNDPLEYCAQYRSRYLQDASGSLSYGCPVTYTIAPRPRYARLGQTALTDGLYGGAGYVESWVGWEGTDADFTIDLGAVKPVRRIVVDFLRYRGRRGGGSFHPYPRRGSQDLPRMALWSRQPLLVLYRRSLGILEAVLKRLLRPLIGLRPKGPCILSECHHMHG